MPISMLPNRDKLRENNISKCIFSPYPLELLAAELLACDARNQRMAGSHDKPICMEIIDKRQGGGCTAIHQEYKRDSGMDSE